MDVDQRTVARIARVHVPVTVLLVAVVLVDPGGVTSVPDLGVGLLHLTEAMVVVGLVGLALAPVLGIVSRQWLLGALAVALVLGGVQWLPNRPDGYPVVAWEVYTRPTTRVPWTEWIVVDGDGARSLPFWPAVPGLPRPFVDQLDPWVDRAVDGDEDALRVLRETVVGVMGEDAPRDGRVEVHRCEVTDDSPSTPATPVCGVALVIDGQDLP